MNRNLILALGVLIGIDTFMMSNALTLQSPALSRVPLSSSAMYQQRWNLGRRVGGDGGCGGSGSRSRRLKGIEMGVSLPFSSRVSFFASDL